MKKNIIIVVFAVMLGMLVPITGYLGYEQYIKPSSSTSDKSDTTDINSVTDETYVSQIYQKNYQSVVTVVNLQETTLSKYLAQISGQDSKVTQGIGSGFVFKKQDGYYYAVTNNHVVAQSDSLQVVLDDPTAKDSETVDAELVGADTNYDVAVIKFKTKYDLPIVTIGDSDDLIAGEPVIAIGSPYGLDFQGSVTSGIVSSPSRAMAADSNGTSYEYIQTDASINPGNSGGPLFNSKGQVIGMNTMKISDSNSDNMGFAIPINTVKEVVKTIEANNE